MKVKKHKEKIPKSHRLENLLNQNKLLNKKIELTNYTKSIKNEEKTKSEGNLFLFL